MPNDTLMLDINGRIFTGARTATGGKNVTGLCGLPSFCSLEASSKCYNISLSECEECSIAGVGVVTAVFVILGSLIVAGNGFILWNVFLRKNGFDDTYGKIRGSLALADIISGLQIFVVVLGSISTTVHSTAHELDLAEQASEGSAAAIIGGIFYLLGFTSSLYHLILLSAHRVYAIALPIPYRLRTIRSTYIGIAVVWLFAIISSTFPLWFPGKLTFSYYSTIFLYFPSYVTGAERLVGSAIISLVFLLVYPYVVMMILSAAAGGMVICYCKKKVKSLVAFPKSTNKQPKTIICRREIKVLKTVVCMQLGFTLTLVPLSVATGLFYSGYLNCENFSTPYLICFILSICNSLVNVVIYFIFDKKFRSTISEAFGRCQSLKLRKISRDISSGGSCRINQDSSSSNTTGSANLVSKQPSFGSKRKNVFAIELQQK